MRFHSNTQLTESALINDRFRQVKAVEGLLSFQIQSTIDLDLKERSTLWEFQRVGLYCQLVSGERKLVEELLMITVVVGSVVLAVEYDGHLDQSS